MNINVPLSGLKNAFYRQDVTANNIANFNTPNYRQRDVVNRTVKGGGVRSHTVTSKASAYGKNGNNVNLIDQMVNQVNNVNQEKANLGALETQNEMVGSLIDLKV